MRQGAASLLLEVDALNWWRLGCWELKFKLCYWELLGRKQPEFEKYFLECCCDVVIRNRYIVPNRELKSMRRTQIDAESSNQYRKFKWIFRCWTGFNLISGFHSSLSFHFVLIFTHCCHTKKCRNPYKFIGKYWSYGQKNCKHICCRVFCRRSYLFMQKKNPFE